MPETKYEYYAALAERTARQLTETLENWTAFLNTAARLYKYPYHEQLMIYAQRPDAIACADYDTWSKTMRRYIRRGTKGIALIDNDSDTPKLKYVYDLADTGTRQNSRPVNLWQMKDEHLDSVFYMLDQNYYVTDLSLQNVFEEVSAYLADEFWDNHRRDIIGIVENSFLEEYTDDTIGVRFREAVTVSTTYTIMARCGMENPFTHEDFLPVFEFNTPDTIAALGTAVSEISEQILRDIEITIKTYERMKEHEERTDLHENGRVRVSEPDPAEPGTTDFGQVREDVQGIPEEPPSDSVQSPDSGGEVALPSDGDRGNSEPQTGTDAGRAGESERSNGGNEVGEPDVVGTEDEQPEIPGRGSDSERTDLQLNAPTPFGKGNQLSLFDLIPTEAEQIESIDKAESEPLTPFAFSFSQEEIDTVLRFGSNTDDHRKRIIAEFMKQKSLDENADFLKGMYHGGNGFIIENRNICAWYAEDGIHLAQGRSAKNVHSAKVLDWEEAAERVGQMLEIGTFATNVELAEAVSHAQRLLSVDIWNLHSYFSDEARENYLSAAMFQGVYEDSVNRISEMLADPFMRDVIVDELARFAGDYAQNRNLLNYHHAPPANLVTRLRELADMTYEYTTDLIELPEVRQFITEDEISESFISHGSGIQNGKYRIYDYLTGNHTDQEKIEFLKNEYGTGGHSHALSGATHSGEDHDSRGIRLKKPDCADVEMSWSNVLKRLNELIQKDRYLSQDEKNARKAHFDAEKVYSPSKAEHPDDIVMYQFGTAYEMYGEDAKKAGDLLNRYVFERDLPGIGVVDMCNVDTNRLNESVEKLRERYDVTVISLVNNEWKTESYPKNPLERSEQEIYGQYYPQIRDFVLEDVLYQNACKNADRDNALLEGESAIRRAVVEIQDTGFMRMYYDVPDFHDRMHHEILEKTYPILIQNAQEQRIDAMLAFAEEVAKESAVESYESFPEIETEFDEPQKQEQPEFTTKTVAVYPAEENRMPFDLVIQTIGTNEPKEIPPENFRITADDLGAGGVKAKFRMNMDAIGTLKQIESENRHATPEEQEILSKYVGWGGLAYAFDDSKENWQKEYAELSAALTPEEYTAARSSTLNAHYTSPTVIKAIYEAVGNMGFQTGNILEPAMGVGNFFGLLPEEMSGSKLYGVELDSITGRIAKQLYPNADITVAGFETTNRRDFFDLAVGNVPFGNYKVNDRAYNKLGFSIHDYFFAKTLDQVRPGGVIAFVTSRYTMDKQSPEVRKYIAERADLLGAIRLPNNAFKANAGTEVVSDILFLQKRDRPQVIEPDWVHLGQNADGFAINSYFIDHPEMILGRQSSESTQYGHQDFTVEPLPDVSLADQLHEAVKHISGQYKEAELPDLGDNETIDKTLPADPNVKNYSYTVVDGDVYYRENSIMVQPNLNATAKERVKGMVEMRDCVHDLIDKQLYGAGDAEIAQTQERLNQLYDDFSAKYGLINDRPNRAAFAEDSSYYLLCSLEILDEDHKLKRKADMFTKRTIMPNTVVTSVDTAAEALAVSIAEKARVDMPYMSELTGKSVEELAADLRGVIFQIPEPAQSDGSVRYVTADEYLSGNVREKLRIAEAFAADNPAFAVNVEALTAAQPKKLEAHEIDVRLGATWIDKEYIQKFMLELLNPAFYHRRKISVNYSEFTAEWNITGKSVDSSNINAFHVYGTDRANAYRILEDTLNLRDIRIYDTVTDADGKERRVLNSKETTLAQQKQQAIKDAFQDWIWKDPDRRHTLVDRYNELFNSSKPREYNGEHIRFNGMNPEISLREHQKNAVAHILYGGNTLLAHEVGAGKTFEMVAAAMESKRLGLCNKPLFAVPNHLTEQWASEFLRLYPSANILVTTKKDFEPANRKKFCARIATGNYDAVIMGHSQFEKVPMSKERQEKLLKEQIEEITDGIAELEASNAERFTIKQLERTKKSLEVRLAKLQDDTRKDDVITFEQLGVDRLYVDEAHSYKNAFIYTKMRNVAGLSTTDSQKSADMMMKCRYLDEITGSKGVVFATGTPVSNSMTELYTMMRYLQHDTLEKKHLNHFDAWASTFGETSTAIELAPEGTGYRARTRFAKFFNLPELMNLFKEAADIKTADQLHLPTPTAIYHNVVAQPTEVQQAMMEELSERATKVHTGTIDPSVDNMLKITSDGRKLGLDQRIINPNLPDDPMSKVNMCVDNIFTIWQENMSEKLTQLVFCDLSTPKGKTTERINDKAVSAEVHGIVDAIDNNTPDEKPFTVYEDIRDKLIARGIPASEIAFIHDADTEVKKKELFGKVRSGQVRVLLGSTSKMGAGTNVQDRLIALHDLDCPWRPGDLEQRKGRIVRQGNMNPEVHIYRYVTEKSFDSYLWQTVENKQKFISQIMTSKSPVRTCDDVDETALSYAEVKALCAGDDRIREKMNLDVDVAKLKVLKADHQSKQHRLEDDIHIRYPARIESAETTIAGLKKDLETVESHPHPADGFAGMEIIGKHYSEKDAAGEALLAVMKEVQGLEPLKIGSYRGFDMSLTLEDFGRQYVMTIKGEISHKVELGKDIRGNLIRIDNALGSIPGRIQAAQAQLAAIREQLETAKVEVGKPFPQEDELKTKSARLIELNAELDIEKQARMVPAEDSPEKQEKKPSILARLQSQKTQPTVSSQNKIQRKEEVL